MASVGRPFFPTLPLPFFLFTSPSTPIGLLIGVVLYFSLVFFSDPPFSVSPLQIIPLPWPLLLKIFYPGANPPRPFPTFLSFEHVPSSRLMFRPIYSPGGSSQALPPFFFPPLFHPLFTPPAHCRCRPS